jgi:hypothetical protein
VRNAELVAVSSGHGRYFDVIVLTQQASRRKCNGLITL